MTYQKEEEYEETKEKMRIVGIILIIVGIGVLVFGIMNIFTAFTSSFDMSSIDNFQNFGSNMMGKFFVGAISVFFGVILLSIGYKLYLATHIRGIAKYTATELAPATTIASEALATGITRGVKNAGGLSLGGSTKEVVRIKCRNCGYLETEDATFCSKCGKPL
ncbi:MAG: hypothetical protein ACTSR2_06075 [Candidatus Hodarchaeales archaeon]